MKLDVFSSVRLSILPDMINSIVRAYTSVTQVMCRSPSVFGSDQLDYVSFADLFKQITRME